MQTYEITATARASIEETWRVRANSADHARLRFERGEAEFVSDRTTGGEEDRDIKSIEPTAEPMPTDAKPEAPQPVSLAAVRFVRDVAMMSFDGAEWEEQTAGLVRRARRIAGAL